MTVDRVALIMLDYPRQLRLKILGRVKVFEGDEAKEWLGRVRDSSYKSVTERVYVIGVEAFGRIVSSILFVDSRRVKFARP